MEPKSAMPESTDPEAADKVRLRIVEGARRHFFANGFRSVTMDDLAQELGMSKKTLYSRFDTKLQLLDAVLEDKFHRARKDFAAVMSAQRSFPETMQAFLDCVQRQTSEIQPPFIRDMRQEGQEVFQKVQRLRRVVIEQYFGELMRIGRRDGFIRKDIPAHIIIEILLAAVQAIINPARMEEWGLTPKTAGALISRVVLEGAIDPESRTRIKKASEP